jgi:hypothetical protein
MNIVRFDKETLLPISFYDSPLPPFYLQNNDFVEGTYHGELQSNPDIYSFYLLDGIVGYDYSVSLPLAKSRSTGVIRELVRLLLTESDVRVKSLLEHLVVDRSDEQAIEKYYTVLSQRKQVRDSSNTAQEMISLCTSPIEAWDIANSFDPRSSPITPLAPEITKNAFQQRLELTVQEKGDPVFQSMTSDLLALGYVDLRQAESKLNFLAQIGKLSAERVSNILSAPIQWKERPVHGV